MRAPATRTATAPLGPGTWGGLHSEPRGYRHGEATKVTVLVLLAPPLAAAQAYFLFNERLSPAQFVGFALALIGVLLVRSAQVLQR